MKCSPTAESIELARRIGEVAGNPDSGLPLELELLAESEPCDDADRCERELLTWVLSGAEIAKAQRAAAPASKEPTHDEETSDDASLPPRVREFCFARPGPSVGFISPFIIC